VVVRSRALLVALVAAALPAALLIAVVIHFTVGEEIFLVVALVLFEWSDRRRRGAFAAPVRCSPTGYSAPRRRLPDRGSHRTRPS